MHAARVGGRLSDGWDLVEVEGAEGRGLDCESGLGSRVNGGGAVVLHVGVGDGLGCRYRGEYLVASGFRIRIVCQACGLVVHIAPRVRPGAVVDPSMDVGEVREGGDVSGFCVQVAHDGCSGRAPRCVDSSDGFEEGLGSCGGVGVGVASDICVEWVRLCTEQ